MDIGDGGGDIFAKFLDIPKLIATSGKVIQPTRYPNTNIVPTNLSLGKFESELQSERDSHYHLVDKIEALNGGYNIVIIDERKKVIFNGRS